MSNDMKTKKGFTLAEMLIVVAIIGILIAIIVPTITNNLEKAREATDLSNLRNAVSMVSSAAISDTMAHSNVSVKPIDKVYYDKYTSDKSEWYCVNIIAKQTKWSWQSNGNNSKYSIAGIETSSSIYGWNVRYCLSGSQAGQILITGMTENGCKDLMSKNNYKK